MRKTGTGIRQAQPGESVSTFGVPASEPQQQKQTVILWDIEALTATPVCKVSNLDSDLREAYVADGRAVFRGHVLRSPSEEELVALYQKGLLASPRPKGPLFPAEPAQVNSATPYFINNHGEYTVQNLKHFVRDFKSDLRLKSGESVYLDDAKKIAYVFSAKDFIRQFVNDTIFFPLAHVFRIISQFSRHSALIKHVPLFDLVSSTDDVMLKLTAIEKILGGDCPKLMKTDFLTMTNPATENQGFLVYMTQVLYKKAAEASQVVANIQTIFSHIEMEQQARQPVVKKSSRSDIALPTIDVNQALTTLCQFYQLDIRQRGQGGSGDREALLDQISLLKTRPGIPDAAAAAEALKSRWYSTKQFMDLYQAILQKSDVINHYLVVASQQRWHSDSNDCQFFDSAELTLSVMENATMRVPVLYKILFNTESNITVLDWYGYLYARRCVSHDPDGLNNDVKIITELATSPHLLPYVEAFFATDLALKQSGAISALSKVITDPDYGLLAKDRYLVGFAHLTHQHRLSLEGIMDMMTGDDEHDSFFKYMTKATLEKLSRGVTGGGGELLEGISDASNYSQNLAARFMLLWVTAVFHSYQTKHPGGENQGYLTALSRLLQQLAFFNNSMNYQHLLERISYSLERLGSRLMNEITAIHYREEPGIKHAPPVRAVATLDSPARKPKRAAYQPMAWAAEDTESGSTFSVPLSPAAEASGEAREGMPSLDESLFSSPQRETLGDRPSDSDQANEQQIYFIERRTLSHFEIPEFVQRYLFLDSVPMHSADCLVKPLVVRAAEGIFDVVAILKLSQENSRFSANEVHLIGADAEAWKAEIIRSNIAGQYRVNAPKHMSTKICTLKALPDTQDVEISWYVDRQFLSQMYFAYHNQQKYKLVRYEPTPMDRLGTSYHGFTLARMHDQLLEFVRQNLGEDVRSYAAALELLIYLRESKEINFRECLVAEERLRVLPRNTTSSQNDEELPLLSDEPLYLRNARLFFKFLTTARGGDLNTAIQAESYIISEAWKNRVYTVYAIATSLAILVENFATSSNAYDADFDPTVVGNEDVAKQMRFDLITFKYLTYFIGAYMGTKGIAFPIVDYIRQRNNLADITGNAHLKNAVIIAAKQQGIIAQLRFGLAECFKTEETDGDLKNFVIAFSKLHSLANHLAESSLPKAVIMTLNPPPSNVATAAADAIDGYRKEVAKLQSEKELLVMFQFRTLLFYVGAGAAMIYFALHFAAELAGVETSEVLGNFVEAFIEYANRGASFGLAGVASIAVGGIANEVAHQISERTGGRGFFGCRTKTGGYDALDDRSGHHERIDLTTPPESPQSPGPARRR